mmetsp:Transcript_59668/g.194659  ORF Transcript_59668/g.194659 Transcript_59668/m.194659 type:complete len:211 (+) Transcript_59668:3346-3978(+)
MCSKPSRRHWREPGVMPTRTACRCPRTRTASSCGSLPDRLPGPGSDCRPRGAWRSSSTSSPPRPGPRLVRLPGEEVSTSGATRPRRPNSSSSVCSGPRTPSPSARSVSDSPRERRAWASWAQRRGCTNATGSTARRWIAAYRTASSGRASSSTSSRASPRPRTMPRALPRSWRPRCSACSSWWSWTPSAARSWSASSLRTSRTTAACSRG